MGLNKIVVTVSIIFQMQGGNNIIGSATGFFYEKNDSLFLVTNQHVMKDEKKGIIPDYLRLRLHKDPNDIRKNDDFEIQLYDRDRNPLWKIHPKYPHADVALIKLDKDKIQKEFFVQAWSKSSFFPKDLKLDPGEDVFVMGYPLAFHDPYHNLPILRNAMIATIYRVHFLKNPLFLIDAELHPGTSGSPVITKPKNVWVDTKGQTHIKTGIFYYLLGIHSGTIDPSITGGEDIRLGAVWYAELVDDIASSF